MGSFDEDLDKLVQQTGGKISKGEFVGAAGLALKALGEVAGAVAVAGVLLYGGFLAIAIGNVFGLSVAPAVVKGIQHLMAEYAALDSGERKAVNTVAGVLWGRIDVVW